LRINKRPEKVGGDSLVPPSFFCRLIFAPAGPGVLPAKNAALHYPTIIFYIYRRAIEAAALGERGYNNAFWKRYNAAPH
jgi:hypothetical protein